MDFLINESQLRTILQEQDQSKMSDYMRELYSFTSNLVNRAKKVYGLNLKLLLTWGASVGGLVMPLDNFIRSGRFDLTEQQITLILIGVACSHFYDNARVFKSIYHKVQEEGIVEPFKEALLKSKNLKDSFGKFLSSSNVTLKTGLELVAYSFLIPIITDIQDIVYNNGDIEADSMLIAKRLIASGVVVVGQLVLFDLIKKIVKKFS